MEIKLIDPEISPQPCGLDNYFEVEVAGILPPEYEDTLMGNEVTFAGVDCFTLTSFKMYRSKFEFGMIRKVTMLCFMTADRMRTFMREVPNCTIYDVMPYGDIKYDLTVETKPERLKFDNAIDCLELEI